MVKQILEKIDKYKLLHFVAGVFIYQSTVWFAGYYALLIVLIAAIGKEIYDHFCNGAVDAYDIIATILGGVIAWH